jgi:hypothetical protein
MSFAAAVRIFLINKWVVVAVASTEEQCKKEKESACFHLL